MIENRNQQAFITYTINRVGFVHKVLFNNNDDNYYGDDDDDDNNNNDDDDNDNDDNKITTLCVALMYHFCYNQNRGSLKFALTINDDLNTVLVQCISYGICFEYFQN